MKKNYLSLFLSVISALCYAQDPVYLTFTSTFQSQSVHPEYITITNVDRGGDTTLIWPDTVLIMIPVSSSNMEAPSKFRLFQNTPNPVTDQSGTVFRVFLPAKGSLYLTVTELTGRKVAELTSIFNSGYSSFRLQPGKSNVYIVSAEFDGKVQSIKVIFLKNNGNHTCSLKLIGTEAPDNQHKSTKGRSNFVYYTGDLLRMTAKYNQFTYSIDDNPVQNKDYIFKFSEILSGENSKTWRLLRDISKGRYPLQVGPNDGSGMIWWALGYYEDLGNRPCMFNDEWDFTALGDMIFRTNGDYWAEGGIFHPDLENNCQATTDMYGPNNEDLSAWDDGNHLYSMTADNITVTGMGAYIGFIKTGTNMEVTVPQYEITYELMKLSEGTTDTLIVQCNYIAGGNMPAYWRYVLMHYDNPQDEPPMPGPPPTCDFDITQDGFTIGTINNSLNAEEYLWDFGDGQTSTEYNPTHTYTSPGIYYISLTAINPSGTDDAIRMVFISDIVLTNEILVGPAWKVKVDNNTVFVGPELGSNEWWSVPVEDLLPGGSWSCMVNDEFIFSTGGNYEYKTNGDARNDGYMGYPVGCITDAELLNSGNGAAFRSAFHTYNFYQGNEYPYIVLTNGASNTAAFVGFYKGYYGGENFEPSLPPNGGLSTNRYELLGYYQDGIKEYLFISVDLNGDYEEGAAWSYILERDVVRDKIQR